MRTIYTAVIAALLATAVTAGAKTMHGRHHRHHGHAATAAQRTNMLLAFGYFDVDRPRWRQRTWNDGHLLPFNEHELWAMEHPDNQWMPFCQSRSYAECGRNSAKNFQRGGDY